MKKNIMLTATLAAAIAATAAGCSQRSGYSDDGYYADRDTAICTDKKGKRVPDRYCQRNGGGGNAFLWYYLGRSSAVPYYGDTVRGGSYTRTAGATYFHAPVNANVTKSQAVSRGGLGSSAKARGGSFGGGRSGSIGG